MFTAASRLQTAQLAEPTTDPFFANVKLLMHFEGPDNSTTFTDQIGHTATPANGAKISTVVPLYGTSSAIFAAPSDYVAIQTSTDFVFAADFTIEFTLQPYTLPGGAQHVIGNYTANAVGHWSFRIVGANSPTWYINGATSFIGPAVSWTVNKPHKIALVRSGTTCTMFIDGIAVGTTTFSGNVGLSTNSICIGGINGGIVNSVSAYIDEVRITNGVARYTSNYTPRKTPFPDNA